MYWSSHPPFVFPSLFSFFLLFRFFFSSLFVEPVVLTPQSLLSLTRDQSLDEKTLSTKPQEGHTLFATDFNKNFDFSLDLDGSLFFYYLFKSRWFSSPLSLAPPPSMRALLLLPQCLTIAPRAPIWAPAATALAAMALAPLI
jgi:hypothetical protein